VPLIDGELAGNHGGAVAVAILEDLQEVVASRGIERLEAPVVEDEEIDAAARALREEAIEDLLKRPARLWDDE
jgi:hypothetical protein